MDLYIVTLKFDVPIINREPRSVTRQYVVLASSPYVAERKAYDEAKRAFGPSLTDTKAVVVRHDSDVVVVSIP